MGKKHFGHWFGKGHWHHKHGKVIGTNDNDSLEGTEKNDYIIGRKGDDELFGLAGNDKLKGGRGDDELYGGAGNDKLYGGKGDDTLEGGAGSDRVYGGKGDDIAVYTLSANAGTDACGRPVRDYYDGGRGKDTLQLRLTEDEYALAEVKADIARFEAFLLDGSCGGRGKVFKFESFDLTVRNFEKLDIVIIKNEDPVAAPDAYEVNEDGLLNRVMKHMQERLAGVEDMV